MRVRMLSAMCRYTIESADAGTFEHYIFLVLMNVIFGDVAILRLRPAPFKGKEKEKVRGIRKGKASKASL